MQFLQKHEVLKKIYKNAVRFGNLYLATVLTKRQKRIPSFPIFQKAFIFLVFPFIVALISLKSTFADKVVVKVNFKMSNANYATCLDLISFRNMWFQTRALLR